jgi:peptidyl-prolyl cis-trans isomerase D
MLNVIRNLVKSIAGKILLLVMVASFAVWGMGDLLRSGDSGLVAIVGNQKITINEFYYQFQKKLNEFNQSLEQKLTEEEAHKQQISYLVLNEMVYGKLIQEFASKNSIYLSDTIIKNAIISIPQFMDDDGNFNKLLFDNAILNNFNNEAEFTDEISRIFLNNLLFENFKTPTPLNKNISNVFYSYEAETRDIIYFNITKSLLETAPITDNEVKMFYDNNNNDYLTKKIIGIRFLNLNPKSFTSSISISNKDVELYYRQNIDRYSQQETRDIEIVNASSFDQSKKILELMNDTAKLSQYIDKEGLVISKLKDVKFNDYDEKISNKIFANPVGIISDPIEFGNFNFLAIKVADINPIKVISLNEVKEEIVKNLKEEQSYQLFLENIDLIEKLNLTGSTLDEIAINFELNIVSAAANDLLDAINADDLNVILASDVGYQSDLIIEENDNIYIVETINIQESNIPAYDEIKQKVRDDLDKFKINEELSSKISQLELLYKYTNEKTFNDFADKNKLKLLVKDRIKRNGSEIFNQQTLDKIFKGNIYSSVMFKDLNDQYGLVFIKNINPADNLINDTEKQKLNININTSFNQSLENIMRNKLANDIKYELFLDNINNLFL